MEKVNLDNLKLTSIRLHDKSFWADMKYDALDLGNHLDWLDKTEWGVCHLTYRNENGEGYYVRIATGSTEEIKKVDMFVQSKMEAKLGLRGRKLPSEGSDEYNKFISALRGRAVHDFYEEVDKRDKSYEDRAAKKRQKQIDKANKLFERINPNKKEIKETESQKPDSDKVLTTPQVTEEGDITTILFETGPRAFYSDTQERDIQKPDVLLLHKDAEDNYLMTWHGMERYTEPYSYDNGAITGEDVHYSFATRGMYFLNEQQAKTLLTSSGKEFQETLESIKAQENFQYKSLREDASQQRSDFIEKDFNLAKKIRDKYFEGIKIQDEELRQKRAEQHKAEQTKKVNEETEKFLDIFSKFKSNGK